MQLGQQCKGGLKAKDDHIMKTVSAVGSLPLPLSRSFVFFFSSLSLYLILKPVVRRESRCRKYYTFNNEPEGILPLTLRPR